MNLYGSRRIDLPTPHYVVFYNGVKEQPDRQVIKLSESYMVKDGTPPCLEMEATVLNVNLGHNRELMEKCPKLYEYAQFVESVRRYHKIENDLTMAVELAIDECIRNGVLTEFLRKNRGEVVDMLLYEYDEEKHIASEKELSYAEGRSKGEAEGQARGEITGQAKAVLELLEELGEIPEKLREEVMDEKSPEVLRRWLKLAARVKTLEEFDHRRLEAMKE